MAGKLVLSTKELDKSDVDALGASHDSLSDVSANDHHNESHNVASHSDTTATGAELETLTDNSIADALHRHSELVASDGTPDPALSVDAEGDVGIGTATPATSALLDLTATTKALLLSRMTTAQKNALTAVNGMVVYDSTLNKFQKYENGSWQDTGGAGSSIWTDEGAYYRPNNVTNSGNTGFRIYDAGSSLLGQVAPTTGNNFGGGSCTDGTVLKINHGNVGNPTADGQVPLWVKRYTNRSGTDWGCGAAYFGAVKTGGTNPLHTLVLDTYCSGGSIPQAHGVLGCLLSHLKNDAITGVQEDIHNMQLITYTPSNDYNSVHDCVAIDLLNRFGSKGWKDFYANGWTCGLSVSNESASAYHNSCAMAICHAGTAGKWYIGIDIGEIAYDAGVAKGEAIRFRTATYDANAVCMRADGALSLRAGGETIVYQTNSIKFKTGTPAAPTTRLEFTSGGNIRLNNATEISWKDNGGVSRACMAMDANNDWWSMSNGRYACIGANCSQANPVLIRINSTNNCQLIRSPDTDSNGKHYVTLV